MYTDDALPHTFSLPHLTHTPNTAKRTHPMMITTSSSLSSSPSSSSHSSPAPSLDLHALSLSLLNTIYNQHNLRLASRSIHPACHVEHELSHFETPSYFNSRDGWLGHLQNKCTRFPGLKLRTKECAVDERQRKVWVVSDVMHGLEEDGERVRKEKVDMLSWDEEGLLVEVRGWVRRVRV